MMARGSGMVCPRCGHERDRGTAAFCPRCGYDFRTQWKRPPRGPIRTIFHLVWRLAFYALGWFVIAWLWRRRLVGKLLSIIASVVWVIIILAILDAVISLRTGNRANPSASAFHSARHHAAQAQSRAADATLPRPSSLRRTQARPRTGAYLRRSKRGGLGELTISNVGQQLDAVAILTTLRQVPAVSVYVRAPATFTLKGIADGTYYLYFAVGQKWDDREATFSQQVSRFRFEKPLRFRTATTAGAIQYSVIHVTLYAVPGGNAPTVPVEGGKFPHP
jgi:hypothetical protein